MVVQRLSLAAASGDHLLWGLVALRRLFIAVAFLVREYRL